MSRGAAEKVSHRNAHHIEINATTSCGEENGRIWRWLIGKESRAAAIERDERGGTSEGNAKASPTAAVIEIADWLEVADPLEGQEYRISLSLWRIESK